MYGRSKRTLHFFYYNKFILSCRKAEIERRANESNQSYVNCQGAPATEK